MDGVGERIRAIRRRKGWTLENLSANCKLSIGFLSQVERGLSSLSIVSLQAISRALEVSLSELFLKEQDHQLAENEAVSPVTKVSEQLRIQIAEYPITYQYLSGEFPNRIAEVLINEFPPNYRHPLATHKGEEFGYVLEGRLMLKIVEDEYSLEPGDSYHFLASKPHSYQTSEKKGARVLIVTTQRLLESHNQKRKLPNKHKNGFTN